MPDIRFECPACGQSLEAPGELAEQLILCPSCSQSITIPVTCRLPGPDQPPSTGTLAPRSPARPTDGDTDEDAYEDEDAEAEPWRSDPATVRQKEKLTFFGIQTKRGVSKGEASDLIEAAMRANPDKEAAWQEYKEDEEGVDDGFSNIEILAWKVNDEDVREVCEYKRLTKRHLREMLNYLKGNVPDWQNRSGFDLGKLVLTLFPDQRKRLRPAASPSVARQPRSTGCVVLLLLPSLLAGALLCSRLLSK